MANSILQDWVTELPLRKQGTLVTGIRGCDGIPKNDPSKPFARALRRAVLNPADPDWKINEPGGFFDSELVEDQLLTFCRQLDHYPLHWVTHFYLAAEVLAYHHPTERAFWWQVYSQIVFALHLNTELQDDFHQRLSDGLRPQRFR
jgi:hypothetical protein